jgi:hypothetical protein
MYVFVLALSATTTGVDDILEVSVAAGSCSVEGWLQARDRQEATMADVRIFIQVVFVLFTILDVGNIFKVIIISKEGNLFFGIPSSTAAVGAQAEDLPYDLKKSASKNWRWVKWERLALG